MEDERYRAKQSNLMKLEAMALFVGLKAQAASERWWYFVEMRSLGREVKLDQRISSFRASLSFDYRFRGIECQVFLEREAAVGQLGEDVWHINISGIEGKANAIIIGNALKPLQEKGYYIPNGNENLERQMNFSLGLYGSCLMQVDVHFPATRPPLPCALEAMDLLDAENRRHSPSLASLIQEAEARQQQLADEESQSPTDDDVMMGDWQTWK